MYQVKLVLQEPFFSWQSTYIAYKRFVGANHAVTRHNDADFIFALLAATALIASALPSCLARSR